MEYIEDLPEQCPPEEAKDQPIEIAYRVVKCDPPTQSCFASQASRNRPLRDGGDQCRHASCSLFSCFNKAKNIAYKLPKPRRGARLIAEMKLPKGAGRSLIVGDHIDFWFYSAFAPTDAVVKVEPV